MMAAEIDQEIRRGTKGKQSLRELVRYLVAWSAREKKVLPLDKLPAMCEKATGVDVAAIYARWMGPVR